MMSHTTHRTALPALLVIGALLLAGCSGSPVREQAGSGQPPDTERLARQSPLRQQVVHNALETLGTPYRYGGNGPRGFDCSGLVQYSHAAAGVRVPRVTSQQRRQARPVALNRLTPGDLLFFEMEGKGRHVGIYLGDGEFIHAPSSGKRVSVSSLDQPYWRARLVAAGSYL